MFTVRYSKQKGLFDLWYKFGEKRRKVLEELWSGLFQKQILPELPEKQL